MITENSVTYQFIGNVARGSTALTALTDGMIALVDEAGVPVTTASVNSRLRVAQKVNGQLVYSPFFVPASASLVAQDYVAPVEQVTYLGFNGTSGQLDTEDGREYVLSLILNHTQGIFNNTPMIKTIPAWVAPQASGVTDSTIQLLLATALVESLNRQFRRAPAQVVIGERVCSDAGDALNTSITNLTFTNGSTVVVTTGTQADIAVGDLLRAGTAVTDPVYKVVSVDNAGNTITLDQPFAGATTTLEDTEAEKIIAADVDDANYGVKLTGVTTPIKDPVSETPGQVSFDVTFDKILNASDNGIQPQILTTVTLDTEAKEGLGTGAQVAVKEVYTTMNEGNAQVCSYPPTKYRRAAELASNYNLIVVNATDEGYTSAATGIKPVSKYNIIMALKDVTADTDLGQFKTVLGL